MKSQIQTVVPRRIDIAVVQDGFSPDHIRVKAGEPVILAFTRRIDRTCAREVVIRRGDGGTVETDLPLGETVVIDATFTTTGQLHYACSMDMITGVITVE